MYYTSDDPWRMSSARGGALEFLNLSSDMLMHPHQAAQQHHRHHAGHHRSSLSSSSSSTLTRPSSRGVVESLTVTNPRFSECGGGGSSLYYSGGHQQPTVVRIPHSSRVASSHTHTHTQQHLSSAGSISLPSPAYSDSSTSSSSPSGSSSSSCESASSSSPLRTVHRDYRGGGFDGSRRASSAVGHRASSVLEGRMSTRGVSTGGAEMRRQFAPLRSWAADAGRLASTTTTTTTRQKPSAPRTTQGSGKGETVTRDPPSPTPVPAPAPVPQPRRQAGRRGGSSPTSSRASGTPSRKLASPKTPKTAKRERKLREDKHYLESPLRPGTNMIQKGQYSEVPLHLHAGSPTAREDASPSALHAHLASFQRASQPGLPTAPYPPSPFIVPCFHLPPKADGSNW